MTAASPNLAVELVEPAPAGRGGRLAGALGAALDARVRPVVRIRGRAVSAYVVAGVIGFVLGTALGLWVCAQRGLALWPIGLLAPAAAATLLGVAVATRRIRGQERLVYYHHEMAIVAVSAVILWLLHRPVAAYLDATVLGVGAFLVCGRVGCFLVGCCHGCPHRVGVRYGEAHASLGFPAWMVGVRLLPIQLVESAWVLATVLGGVGQVLRGADPGAVVAWYAVVYGLGRFAFEWLRGDARRGYFRGASEAQWITLGLVLLTSLAELAGWLPMVAWHVVAAGAVAAATAVLVLRDSPERRLLRPAHVHELAQLLASARDLAVAGGDLRLGETSQHLQVSASRLTQAGADLDLLAFSWKARPLAPAEARRLAVVLTRLWGPAAEGELVAGRQGVFHLLLPRRGGPVPPDARRSECEGGP